MLNTVLSILHILLRLISTTTLWSNSNRIFIKSLFLIGRWFGLVDVLVKPLKDNAVAICVFNKTNKENGAEIKLKDIANLGYVSLPKKEGYSVHDVWDNKFSEGTTMISAAPEAHGVKVYIVK